MSNVLPADIPVPDIPDAVQPPVFRSISLSPVVVEGIEKSKQLLLKMKLPMIVGGIGIGREHEKNRETIRLTDPGDESSGIGPLEVLVNGQTIVIERPALQTRKYLEMTFRTGNVYRVAPDGPTEGAIRSDGRTNRVEYMLKQMQTASGREGVLHQKQALSSMPLAGSPTKEPHDCC